MAGPKNTPLTEVSYVAPMLWAIGVFIPVAILAHIAAMIVSPKDTDNFKKDERDHRINRLSEYSAQSFVIIGGLRQSSWRCSRRTISGSPT